MLDVTKASHGRKRMDKPIQDPQIVVCYLKNALSLFFIARRGAVAILRVDI